ncbi:OmpL47-type beta-barrel domain-containing protein [Tumebacillus permanentifrigoris]|uniref:OmpL47-type beta-barrel domain-containing protein n=1 Tax=Tumebacillus permanentifrigoris TaxID=378543 RepID=UPI003CCC81C9
MKSVTVQLDRTAPSVTGASVGEHKNGWYDQDFNFAVAATDENSGVAQIEVKLNEGDWTTYNGSISITQEGLNTVEYRATDKAGNVSVVQTSELRLDKTAPSTEASLLNGANETSWNHQNVTFAISATDTNSGLASTEVKIDDADWVLYTEPVTISAEGIHKILYRATDLAGNIASAKSITVQLDKNAPAIKLTQDGGAIHDVFADGKLLFNLSVTDAVSGVSSQALTLDDQAITSGAAIDASTLTLGVHTVKATAVDKAGNVSEVSYTFLIDTNLLTVQNLMENFAATGEVKNKGILTSLEAKLNTAQKFVEKGKPDQAAKHLQDLKATLSSYANNGNVSQHAATVLNANLEYLLTHVIK